MKRGPAYKWIPLWVDKWLWGSTRHELNHDERAIFVDLLALASKDDGHIRANEQTPYPIEQLAGMLNAPIDLLKTTISKCIKFNKITEKEGFYFINNWNEYRLTGGYKRAVTAFNKAHSAFSSKSKYKSKSSSLKNKNLKERIEFKERSWVGITEEDKKAWAAAYPACDIELNLKGMIEWIVSNPAKGKKSNYRRFITGWLKREQDKGGSLRGRNIKPPESERDFAKIEADMKARQEARDKEMGITK